MQILYTLRRSSLFSQGVSSRAATSIGVTAADIEPPPSELGTKTELHEILRFCRRHIQQRLGKNRWYANFPGSSPLWYKYLPMQLLTILLSQLLHIVITPSYNLYHSLDTWACGDFTLMHREDWHDIQGYAELDAYSLHIDSLALGYSNSIRQKASHPST